jgi:hypothetical protein
MRRRVPFGYASAAALFEVRPTLGGPALWSSLVKLYFEITSHILLTNDANAPADLADKFH